VRDDGASLRLALIPSFWFYSNEPPLGGVCIPRINSEKESDDGEEVVCESDEEADEIRCGGAEIAAAAERPEGGAQRESGQPDQGLERDRRSGRRQRWQISAVGSTMVEAVPPALTNPT